MSFSNTKKQQSVRVFKWGKCLFAILFFSSTFLYGGEKTPQYRNQFPFFSLGLSIVGEPTGFFYGPLIGVGYRWEKGNHGQDLALDLYFPPSFNHAFASLKYQYFYRFGKDSSRGFYLGPAFGVSIVDYSCPSYGLLFPAITVGFKIADHLFFEVNPSLVLYTGSDCPLLFINSKIGIGF
ncbi:MAG: hypothetical protein AAF443_04545 [Chlamydiota bacterium]